MPSLLTRDRITEIRTFFYTANIQYDDGLRSLLLDGINNQFVGQMTNFNNDAYQLSGDLKGLNSVERLADGTVPFEVWLRNAADQLSFRDTTKVLSRALDELINRMSGAVAISEAASIPDLSDARKAMAQRDDMVAFEFLAAGSEAGKSVARLEVPRHDDGMQTKTPDGLSEVHQGTGWLLTPDLLMTNHHVVNARIEGQGDAAIADLELQASNALVQFDYEANNMTGTSLRVTKLEAYDMKLDYAVLRLESSVARVPLIVNQDKIVVKKDSYIAVNIIQHPNGGPKRVALRNNLVYDSNFPMLRYFTDTEQGSSGSPVFNDGWQVVALHRASTFVNKDQVTGWVNEGTQMAAIMDDLKLKNQAVYQAVTGKNTANY
jgi:endonuclease G